MNQENFESDEGSELNQDLDERKKKDVEESPSTQAQKKERQPTRADDLSSIHNTHEVGTSGGDQRAKDNAPVQDTPDDPAHISNLGAEEVPPPPLHNEDEN